MALRSGLAWLARAAAAPRTRRKTAPDHGDVGTAYGLDASFAHQDVTEASAGPTRATPRRSWEERANRRHGEP